MTEESYLNELNSGWREVKTLISQTDKEISALNNEKEHYEYILQTLKCIGDSGGYTYHEEKDEWRLKYE